MIWAAVYALLMPLALGVLANYEGLRRMPDLAAWMQAGGSVLAIGAAIWIDQGSSRRAREARAASDQKMRDDRILAVMYCASVLRDIGTAFEAKQFTGNAELVVADGSLRALDVAQRAIDYYVANAGEVGPDLMGVMAHAQHVLADGRQRLADTKSFKSEAALKAAAKAFNGRAQDIADVLAELHPHSPRLTEMLQANYYTAKRLSFLHYPPGYLDNRPRR